MPCRRRRQQPCQPGERRRRMRPSGCLSLRELVGRARALRHGESSPVTSQGGPQVVDMKLEVVVIPVSDVDRAKEFYAGLGWRLDADVATGDDFRLIQFTPPVPVAPSSSARTSPRPPRARCRVHVPDRLRHRRPRATSWPRAGVEVTEVFHCDTGFAAGSGARTHRTRRRAWAGRRQLQLVRLVQRPGRQQLAAPGGHDPAPGPRSTLRRRRSRRRADLAEALRRAAAAHGEHEARTGQGGPGLAELVRDVHGPRAGR